MTAPTITRRNEIIRETVSEDGERTIRYRWFLGGGESADGVPLEDSSGESWAMDRVEPMPRTILLDRWNGLIGADSYTELGDRLSAVLDDFAEGMTRRGTGEVAYVDEHESIGLDVVLDVDGLIETIREWFIDHSARVASR
jgi:hypothetical protein